MNGGSISVLKQQYSRNPWDLDFMGQRVSDNRSYVTSKDIPETAPTLHPLLHYNSLTAVWLLKNQQVPKPKSEWDMQNNQGHRSVFASFL